jgi:hypothetical protein
MRDFRPWSVMTLFTVILLTTCPDRASAQGEVLFPGSTVPGDTLRGEGVMYHGAAVYHLNAAAARSMDADTRLKFEQAAYQALQEYNRQRAQRLASAVAKSSARLEDVQRRLREAPTDSDVAGGDALNAALADLADPQISPERWASVPIPLEPGIAKRVPLRHSTAGGVLSLRRLTVADGWPIALRYETLSAPRDGYSAAVARLMAECRERRLAPESIEAVGAAARDLSAQVEPALRSAPSAYRAEGRRFADRLARQAATLTRSVFVEDLLAELDIYRGATVGELVDLLRRYRLHFGPAEDPVERELYLVLFPALIAQRKALGLEITPAAAITSPGVTLASITPGTDPIVGRWSSNRGTTAVPSIFEFRPDGSLIYERYGQRALGTWRREGERVVFETTSPDPRLVIRKWLTITSRREHKLDVLMEGERVYSWIPAGAPVAPGR